MRVSREQVRSFADGGDAESLGTDLKKLAHGGLRASVDLLQELEGVVGVAVDDVDADGGIHVVGKGILAHERTCYGLKIENWLNFFA